MARSLLLAIAATLACAATACAAPYSDRVLTTAGLAGYWALDERAGPLVADLRAADAGLHEGDVRAGMPPLAGDGRSVHYDGRHAVTRMPNARPLNPTRALTLEAWTRPDDVPHAATVAGKPGQYALGFTRQGAAVLRVWTGGRMARVATAPGAVAGGRTTHLAGSYDGRRARLYVDGRPRAARTLGGALDKGPEALVLGGGLRGRLDEVALYDAALPAAALAAHERAGRRAPCTAGPMPVGVRAVWRPACWRPYLPGSPFNQPLRDDVPRADDSGAIVARLAGRGGPAMIYGLPRAGAEPADGSGDYQHPLYAADWTAAPSAVRCQKYACPELRGVRVAPPPGASPAQAADGHMAVFDDAAGTEVDLWQVGGERILPGVPGDGKRLTVSAGGVTRADEGLNWGLGSNATAATFGLAAGVIRAPELVGGRIDHALFLAVDCTSGVVAPARGEGARCDDGGHGAPPMGARLRLRMSNAEIAALGVPRWKRAVLRALARYGGYVGDTGASKDAAFEVAVESGETYTSLGAPDFVGALWARVDGEHRFANYRYFDLARDVDWHRLEVVDACEAERRC